MYDVPDNSFYSNVLPGHASTEFNSYRVYVRLAPLPHA